MGASLDQLTPAGVHIQFVDIGIGLMSKIECDQDGPVVTGNFSDNPILELRDMVAAQPTNVVGGHHQICLEFRPVAIDSQETCLCPSERPFQTIRHIRHHNPDDEPLVIHPIEPPDRKFLIVALEQLAAGFSVMGCRDQVGMVLDILEKGQRGSGWR